MATDIDTRSRKVSARCARDVEDDEPEEVILTPISITPTNSPVANPRSWSSDSTYRMLTQEFPDREELEFGNVYYVPQKRENRLVEISDFTPQPPKPQQKVDIVVSETKFNEPAYRSRLVSDYEAVFNVRFVGTVDEKFNSMLELEMKNKTEQLNQQKRVVSENFQSTQEQKNWKKQKGLNTQTKKEGLALPDPVAQSISKKLKKEKRAEEKKKIEIKVVPRDDIVIPVFESNTNLKSNKKGIANDCQDKAVIEDNDSEYDFDMKEYVANHTEQLAIPVLKRTTCQPTHVFVPAVEPDCESDSDSEDDFVNSMVQIQTKPIVQKPVVVEKKIEQPKITRLCKSVFMKTVCRYGRNCNFAHKVSELFQEPCQWGAKCNRVCPFAKGVYITSDRCDPQWPCQYWHPNETVSSYEKRIIRA